MDSLYNPGDGNIANGFQIGYIVHFFKDNFRTVQKTDLHRKSYTANTIF